jgi:hypothetical protein
LPVLDSSKFRSHYFKPLEIIVFWYFFAICLFLGWLGQETVDTPYIELSIFGIISYFSYFVIAKNFFAIIEI